MLDAIPRLSVGQFGLVTRPQLLAMDLDPKAISRLLGDGDLRAVFVGVYRLPGHPVTWKQRLMAVQLLAGGGSAISFEAAAMEFDIDRIRADQPHVTVVHAQKLNANGFVVHRTRLFVPGDVVQRGPLRFTSPYRTLIDLAGVLSVDRLEDALDHAIRHDLVAVRPLLRRLEIRGRRGVPGIGNLARLLEDRVGQRPKASSLQNRFRRGLCRAGLPEPEEEYPVYNSSGRFCGRVDFAYPEKKVYIEVDGSHHETRKQRDDDITRQNALAGAGWRPLRYGRAQVNAKAYVPEIGALFRTGESGGTYVYHRIPQNREKR